MAISKKDLKNLRLGLWWASVAGTVTALIAGKEALVEGGVIGLCICGVVASILAFWDHGWLNDLSSFKAVFWIAGPVVVFVVLGYWVFPEEIPFAFPWVEIASVSNSSTPLGIEFYASVREWPIDKGEWLKGHGASIDSISDFHLKVFKNDRQNGFIPGVMQIDESQWNNAAASKLSPLVTLNREVTLFTYLAQATKAQWGGYIILRKNGLTFDQEEGITGTVILSNGRKKQMQLTVCSTKKSGKPHLVISRTYWQMTPDRLGKLGIPLN